MPNYGLVVTPTYNPMSYEQYIQPFKDYAQVYNATVDQIDALEMEANQWERLADSDIDAPQYQQYKSYADDLRKYANEIATQGLSSRTRAGLSRMRQRYAKEIKPIEDAFNRRQEAIKSEDALLAKDPSFVLAGSARDKGLSQYMSGTPQTYGVSGNDVYTKTLAAFQAISKRKVNFDEARRFGGAYYSLIKEVGEDNPQAVLGILQNMLEDPEIAGDPEKLNEVQGLTEYAQAVNSVLESTHYNKLSTEGKDRILQSAIAGGITGMVYDKDEHLYQNPWVAARAAASAQQVPPATPATSSTIIRGQVAEPKDAVKVRQDLNDARGKVMNPWDYKGPRDSFAGRFSNDDAVKRDFGSPIEATVWADDVIEQVDSFLSNYNAERQKAAQSGSKIPSSAIQLTLDGQTLSVKQASALKKNAEEIKERLSKYKESVDPYFRTLQIDDNNFATDQQLAQIAQIQQNVSARQSYTKELASSDSTDRQSKKDRYEQITKGSKNTEKTDHSGLWEIDEKSGKAKKVTSSGDYDSIVENGDLIYSSEYGIVVRDKNNKLYYLQGDVDLDAFNNSHKAIIQALNFDDTLYKLPTNNIKSATGDLVYLDDGKGNYNPQTAVYDDRNIRIYEGLDQYGQTRRDIIDKITGRLITSISLMEATDMDGFLASGEYQQGINNWMQQALGLLTISNDRI